MIGTRGLVAFLLLINFSCESSFAAKSNYNINFDTSFRYLPKNPNQKNDHYLYLLYDQKFEFDKKNSLFLSGISQTSSEYYSLTEDYDNYKAFKDVPQFYLGENYYQFKNKGFSFRFGYQNVVWGETFGLFFSDFINSKDLRISPFSPTKLMRKPAPMINIKWLTSWATVQGIYLITPQFHTLGPPSFYLGTSIKSSGLPVKKITVNQYKNPDYDKNHDMGYRISKTIGNTDMSFYQFAHYDRFPYYELQSANIFSGDYEIRELHERVLASGLAGSSAIGDFVIRTELLQFLGRKYNYKENLLLLSAPTEEQIAVLSAESPTIKDTIFSVQVSQSTLKNNKVSFLRGHKQSYLSLRSMTTLKRERSFELNYILATNDKSTGLKADYFWPLTDSLEMRLGIESYNGKQDTDFGRWERINSFFVRISTYIRG